MVETKHNTLELFVDSGVPLDVRQVRLEEGISILFQVSIVAMSREPDIDLDTVVGQPARFMIHGGTGEGTTITRHWTGIIAEAGLLRVEPAGYSTYQLTLVPPVWLMTQRTNYRIFQQMSEPQIALKLLEEWNIHPLVEIDLCAYKTRKYKVQYNESDFAFLSRVLEDAGISYSFREKDNHTFMVLTDHPQDAPPRASPLPFHDEPSHKTTYVTAVRVGQQVRPGRYTIRDHDYRLASDYKLLAEAADGAGSIEDRLERFHYVPGAFLFGAGRGEDTPSADDKGKTRTDEKEAAALAKKRLEAKRASRKTFSFETNALDVGAGSVVSFLNHRRSDLGEGKRLLVTKTRLEAANDGEFAIACDAVSADLAYRPPLLTPKPRVKGVESATVVGPRGEEIHTDEFGRVRVTFHWDRESRFDQDSSCWLHVSQPWAGQGYGGMNVPRVGQEVIVDFLGGDPDRPIITGRVYTNLEKAPYTLPANKTQTGWKSNSTGKTGGYNEIRWEDQAGREVFSVQAERDMSTLVKRNADTQVRGKRSTWTKGHETKQVNGNQTIAVVVRRDLTVHGNSTLQVKNDITTSTDKSLYFDTREGWASKARGHVFEGLTFELVIDCGIVFETDASKILMDQDGIAILSPDLLINPGAPEPGATPITDAEAQSDRAWADREYARLHEKTDDQIEAELWARQRAGHYDVPALQGRPSWYENRTPAEKEQQRQEWREGAIRQITAMNATDREFRLNRSIAPDVRNRYPRPTVRRRPRYPVAGL